MHIFYILIYLFISVTISVCVPFKREDTNTKDIFKNERRFPNGTVIGIYSYKDADGNPVCVKYYADDSNYGVELKSVRIIEEDSAQSNRQDKLIFKIDETLNSSNIFGPIDNMSATKSIIADKYYKNYTYDPYEVIHSYPNKKIKGHHKSDDEYEIFLENVLKSTDNHNKGKVRVYVDKNRRKVRKIQY